MGHFLVLGRDERQKYLFRLLCKKGQTVTLCDTWLDGDYDAVLLPAAQTAQYMAQAAPYLQAGQYVFGCNFPAQLVEQKKKEGIFFIDYMKEPGVAYENAAVTAEGALAEAIGAGDEALFGKNMLVIGYGCCGQALAVRLAALGASVTVYEKDCAKCALARSLGFAAVCAGADTKPEFFGGFSYLFNTAPALVLDEARLACVRPDAVLIDLASLPGGIERGYCKKRGLNAKHCGGLPAKYAPFTAAQLFFQVVESYQKEVMSGEG